MDVEKLRTISSELGYNYDIRAYPNRVERWLVSSKVELVSDELSETEFVEFVNISRFVSDGNFDVVIVSPISDRKTFSKIKQYLENNGYRELVS